MFALSRVLPVTETVKLFDDELVPAPLLGGDSTPFVITPITKSPGMTMRTTCHHLNFRFGGWIGGSVVACSMTLLSSATILGTATTRCVAAHPNHWT